MDRFEAMHVFINVARYESFAATARKMNKSRPAVTRAIAFLEEVTGAQLLTRTTRSVALTHAGERYLGDCKRIIEAVAEAEAAAAGSYTTPSGELVITAPKMFGRLHIAPILGDFLQKHPTVTGRLLLLDRITHMIDEGIDVALRISRLADSSLVTIRVGHVTPVLVCSPRYIETNGAPQSLDELSAHDLLVQSGLPGKHEWSFEGPAPSRLAIRPHLRVNDAATALDLAQHGFGITRLLSYQTARAEARGELVRVLQEHEPEPIPVQLVRPQGQRIPAKTRHFLDFSSQRLREEYARGWGLRSDEA